MCRYRLVNFWCNCPRRNTTGVCPHSEYVRTSAAEVEVEPVVNGWFTRLAGMYQSCLQWCPLPAYSQWQHCATYLSNNTDENGTIQYGLEEICEEPLQAQTEDNPSGHIISQETDALCLMCQNAHGSMPKGTERKPKKKEDKDGGKSSKPKKGKTTRRTQGPTPVG